MFDKKAMKFQARVVALAKRKLGVKCEGSEAEPYLDQLYAEYQAAGEPEDMDTWITERLKKDYLCVSTPPQWIEDEPIWPFFRGKPMVFISQTRLPRNEVTENHLTWDVVVYLFGARVPAGDGYRVEYKAVMQIEGIDGSGLR